VYMFQVAMENATCLQAHIVRGSAVTRYSSCLQATRDEMRQ
jgi:hypothetical protein